METRTGMGRGMEMGMGMEMGTRTEIGTTSRGFSAEFAAFSRAASLAASWVQAGKMGMCSRWPGWGGGTHQELGVSQLHRGRGLSPQAELRGAGGLPAPPVGRRLGVPSQALPGPAPEPVALPGQGWWQPAELGHLGFVPRKTWQDPLLGGDGKDPAGPPLTLRRAGLGVPREGCCDRSPKGVT